MAMTPYMTARPNARRHIYNIKGDFKSKKTNSKSKYKIVYTKTVIRIS